MLELQALSPTDGWAIVARGDEIYLIRPPYRLTQRERLAAEKVPAVVKHLDLWAREISFESWRDLIEHLRSEMARNADPKYLGRAAEASRKILARASVEDLHRHLDRLQDRLEGGDWRGTMRAVNVFLALQQVREDGGLLERCRELLDRCIEVERKQSAVKVAVGLSSETQKSWFHNAFAVHGREVVESSMTEIATRQQVMPMGG